jgi:tRNA pseudouridine55 synthase
MSLNPKNLNDVNGILIFDKPAGMSSNHALQKVKRLFKAKKAGYAGTLDPFATGMLPICFGKATKLVEQLHEHPKCYRATLRLGVATSTGDTEGEIIEKTSVPEFNEDQLKKIISQFIGDIMQVPPMYSALKHQGQPLYKLARQGKTIERPARPAKIYALKIIEYTPDTITFEAICGKGVYIRTLGEDIAKALGACGHLIALRRLYCAGFLESDMRSFTEIEHIASDNLISYLK